MEYWSVVSGLGAIKNPAPDGAGRMVKGIESLCLSMFHIMSLRGFYNSHHSGGSLILDLLS